ncbi:MAG: c-type cytochrome biogenesis protein CcmI [Betaproteobacteria bacterium]|nr:c-type cytochrome biogenesis protein CcmI [Betaproteobacteria bacterium]
MVWFWLMAGLLVIVVLALLLRPLLSRRGRADVSRNALNTALYADQLRELDADLQSGALAASEVEAARRELKVRLLADVGQAEASKTARGGRGAAIAIGVAIPVIAVGVYFAVGNPGALAPKAGGDAAHEMNEQQVEAMVERLVQRLKREPENVGGWILLGRSYNMFGRFRESADAYANAVKLRPTDAQLLADYADALGMALGRNLAGEPEKLVARALQIDPRNLKALALAGTIAYERKDYSAAAAFWERMLPLLPPDSDDARSIRANVEEARSLSGERVAKKESNQDRSAAPASALRGSVQLAPALAAKAAPTDTVFIFARAAAGPPMPLAVLRKQVRDLPVAFALDDSMAMASGMRLSEFPRVVVGARISKSAGAAAQPGDLQGLSAPVANNAGGVSVVIDSVVR